MFLSGDPSTSVEACIRGRVSNSPEIRRSPDVTRTPRNSELQPSQKSSHLVSLALPGLPPEIASLQQGCLHGPGGQNSISHRAYMYVSSYLSMCLSVCLSVCLSACLFIHRYANIYVQIHVYTCIYLYNLYMKIYIHMI